MTTLQMGEALKELIREAQHRIATALGVDEQRRAETVLAMQKSNARRAPGYWIQLFLSMGIATLGLVLGSTAVVIGAMLVSPLMGPLIELGMGFAVGSSLLVIRAFLRVILSVLLVVIGAMLFTLALPFHEVTSEIASRAAPTALDLLVAIFCALTATYTTVRPGADSIAAAAGTAIGIALVPPLCTIGFGLGTGSFSIAGGAALLFIANLSAILVFAVLSFFVLGFNQVDAEAVEQGFLTEDDTRTDKLAARAHRLLSNVFGSRYGMAMRLVIPAVFLAAVYIPLLRALDEVTWEVRTRDAIRRILAAESPGAVQTSVVVDRHTVGLRLLVIGSSARAANLETVLEARIAEAAGVMPTVSVVPVADARTLAATAAAEIHPQATAFTEPLSEVSQHLGTALGAVWPAPAGRLAGWEVSIAPRVAPTVVVRHVGPPLGDVGSALLSQALAARLGTTVRLRDVPIDTVAIAMRSGRETVWADSALALLDAVVATDSVVACLRAPSTGRGSRSADRAMLDKLMATNAGRAGRISLGATGSWTIRAAVGHCASAAADTGSRARK
jgi:uncharacterized hydrophobic protein (TIGR00271 family)